MKLKVRKEVDYFVTVTLKEGEVELPVRLAPDNYAEHVVTQVDKNTVVLGYLIQDQDCEDPITSGDGMGRIYSGHRSAGREHHAKMQEALGLDCEWQKRGEDCADPYAVMLDCYEHGGQEWSVSGGGMQCQWDTARGAGVWVPDHCLVEMLEELPKADRYAKAVVYAKQALEEFNSWRRGDCWGVVVVTCKRAGDEWEMVESDEVWGHVGSEWAEQALKENVDCTVKYLKKKVKKA